MFSPNQFGFLPGKGIDMAIDKHVSTIVSNSDQYKYSLAVYLDFQKAFDVLDLNILMTKFKKYGIGGRALLWLESFCRERKQIVKINNIESDICELKYGTAQGGVLGPLIFLIFINDLLDIRLNSKIFAYADDTAVVCSAYNRETLKRNIHSDLNNISSWLITHKLLINSSKSKCVIFFDHNCTSEQLKNCYNLICHKHKCIYGCICSPIEVVDYVKYLGLVIDKHLKWDHHIIYLSKKLRKVNYSLYFMKSCLKSEHLKQLYLSWFESTLRYGIIHYGGAYANVVRLIIMCQRHALRIIFNIKKRDRLSYIFIEHNLLTFKEIHMYACLMYIHKNLGSFPLKQFSRVTRAAQYITLEVPRVNKESSRHQFCYLGPKMFNRFIEYFGNEVIFERKPKFKMKVMVYIRENYAD